MELSQHYANRLLQRLQLDQALSLLSVHFTFFAWVLPSKEGRPGALIVYVFSFVSGRFS